MHSQLLIVADDSAQLQHMQALLQAASAHRFFKEIRCTDSFSFRAESISSSSVVLFCKGNTDPEIWLHHLKSLKKRNITAGMLLDFAQHTTTSLNRFLEAGCSQFVFSEGSADSEIGQAIQAQLLRIVFKKELEQKQASNFRFPFPTLAPYEVAIIGASSGGAEGVESIIESLSPDFHLPLVVAQHFSASVFFNFVERLKYRTKLRVTVPQMGEPLLPSTIYLLSPFQNIIFQQKGNRIFFQATHASGFHYNNPSIELLLSSAVRVFGKKVIGILLSGMGEDGTDGLLKVRQAKGMTLVQEPASSLISKGMPTVAIAKGGVQQVLTIGKISSYLNSLVPEIAAN